MTSTKDVFAKLGQVGNELRSSGHEPQMQVLGSILSNLAEVGIDKGEEALLDAHSALIELKTSRCGKRSKRKPKLPWLRRKS